MGDSIEENKCLFSLNNADDQIINSQDTGNLELILKIQHDMVELVAYYVYEALEIDYLRRLASVSRLQKKKIKNKNTNIRETI